MIIIGDTLLSDELYLEQFLCDLNVCKGACCVEGDAGAPLEPHETAILEDVYDHVKPFMIPGGIRAVEAQGHWVGDEQGDFTTPLVDGRQCAYVYYDVGGLAKCAIEQAHGQGLVDFLKPISCHLYPIRITRQPNYEALNYHRWPICDCARKLGRKKKIRVYQFVKDALVRKYGVDWYDELEAYIRYGLEQEETEKF